MKKLYILQRATLFRGCSEKTFKIIRLTTLLLMVTVLNVFGGNTFNTNLNLDKATDPAAIMQQNRITGTVTDEKGNPLPGVTVTVKGTTLGTLSDATGKYTINNATRNATLIFSFVGMTTQEIPSNNRILIDVVLKENAVGLDEVVVIGYGTQKRKDLTGSFGQVKSEDLLKTVVVGFDQALQGKISGVQVTNNSGEPGGSISIRIRGVGSINSSSEPLYIIDGVPYSSLNAINVNDIDRIDVLKDAASASIYGSRASNGVVLVTTKRGQKGLVVSFDAYAGVQSIAKKMDVLNGPQFALLANEYLVNSGFAPNPAWSNPSTVLNTDWQSAVLQTAPMQNYNLNISGGGDKLTNMFSFGYLDQGGILINSRYKRYTVRLNSDYIVSKKIKIGITLNGSFDKKENQGSADSFGGILNQALAMQPTMPITTSVDGYFGLNPDGSVDPAGKYFFGWNGYAFTSKFRHPEDYTEQIQNPLYIKKYYLQNPSTSQQILASAFAEYEVISGLKLKSTINLTYGHNFSQGIRYAAPTELDLTGQLAQLPTYSEFWDQSNNWNWVNTISYNKSFGKHNIGAIAGMDALEDNYRYVNVNTNNAPADQLSITASDGSTRISIGFPSKSGLLSYFGRVSYDYEGKYLIAGTIRRDGSSNFGPNKQYGLFSSGSIGWRISQENFMKSVDFINDLKIRASYGSVGNQNIPPFMYMSTYTNNGGTVQYTLGKPESAVTAMFQNVIGNPNIHWEKSIQTDLGFDLSVMKSKLSLTADYYIKKLSDMLGNFPVPTYTGIFGHSVLQNGFSMEDRGLELALNYREKIGEVNFSAGANFSNLGNKVTKLTDNEKGYISNSITYTNGETRTYLGSRIGEFYGYLTDGIVQTAEEAASNPLSGLSAGDRKYKDVNGDGKIDSNDEVALGNGLPKYLFGMNLKADYKGFDISVLLSGQAGVQIANQMVLNMYDLHYFNGSGIVNGSVDLMNRWTGEGTSNTMPRNSYTRPPSDQWFSDVYIEDGSFLRVSNVQIGYTLKPSMLSKVGVSEARFYLSGQNLFTFTKYSGYDPEVGSNNQTVLQTGIDYGRYPLARMLGIGLTCKF